MPTIFEAAVEKVCCVNLFSYHFRTSKKTLQSSTPYSTIPDGFQLWLLYLIAHDDQSYFHLALNNSNQARTKEEIVLIQSVIKN